MPGLDVSQWVLAANRADLRQDGPRGNRYENDVLAEEDDDDAGGDDAKAERGDARRKLGAAFERTQANILAHWLDADENPLGDSFELELPEIQAIEHPGATGRLMRSITVHPLQLEGEQPPNAAYLRLAYQNSARQVARSETERVAGYASLPGYLAGEAGLAGARITFHVFAERFTAVGVFQAKVAELADAIRAALPVANDGTVPISLKWHFAPSNPATGHFDTPDSKAQIEEGQGRLFFGDQAKARDRIAGLVGERDFAVVLINSTIGGGAGGTKQYANGRVYTYPAWASTTSRNGEHWWQLALHELGHALGLGDEYEASNPDPQLNPLDPSIALEPNIDRTGDLALVKWQNELREQPEPVVAAFEGARYSPRGLFRPSPACCMRSVIDPFCPVCLAAIRDRLGLQA